MYTYIIESQGFIKIGKAEDVPKRMRSYNTHNPSFVLLKVIEGAYENILHELLSEYRIRNEWFILPIDRRDFLLGEEVLQYCEEENRLKNERISKDTEVVAKGLGIVETITS